MFNRFASMRRKARDRSPSIYVNSWKRMISRNDGSLERNVGQLRVPLIRISWSRHILDCLSFLFFKKGTLSCEFDRFHSFNLPLQHYKIIQTHYSWENRFQTMKIRISLNYINRKLTHHVNYSFVTDLRELEVPIKKKSLNTRRYNE